MDTKIKELGGPGVMRSSVMGPLGSEEVRKLHLLGVTGKT
jgi:hypothetical protein